MSELLMGINSMRKKLAKKCHGHVLEVSCGTGRNLGYYDITGKDAQVDSLTFIDISPQMVEMCKKKWDALYGSQRKRKALNQNLRVRFMTGSAIDAMPLAPSGKRYETIIQTMGLCSTPSPLPLLTNMVKHLDTSNPDSRILLLEHGRSYMPWMNNILDNSAEKHAEIHGCWFNREIGDLVEAAAEQTGLEVVSERRHHFGTTWVFELKPKDETVKAARAETGEAQSADEVEDKKLGWLNWLKAPSE
ncbi:Methyltransferase domain [Teratosphaeria destructans]|uniref:Methyltransferase domain n=1 Tax=Teratosphaeria destructans TaxID=418781 RepID=A0A9W7T079_9PEZI|nr:Methyltransferase domain [Teratosphaeria destructans]